jgi:hypothetical protein
LSGLLAGTACGKDHSWLALTTGGADAGAAGAGAAAGGTAGGSGGGGTSASGNGGSAGSIVEPDGPQRLTLVNGIVDSDAIRLCFTPYPDGPTPGAEPWPGIEGLPFARAVVVASIATVIPAATDVEVLLVAGELSHTGGKTCAELWTAPPAGVLVRSLGVVPASFFTVERSLLLVPNGCVGGQGHTDPSETQVCGAAYAPDKPTAAMAAGFMSRLTTAGKLSLQLVHAVASMPTVNARLVPSSEGATHYLVTDNWSLGAIAPYPPFQGLAVSNLGLPEAAALEIEQSSQPQVLATLLLGEAFANGTVGASDLDDGTGLVLVAVGAAPGMVAGPWWRALTLSAIAADP